VSAQAAKVALVTGGTRGIGAAITSVLVRDGFSVVVSNRGGRPTAPPGDVTLITGDLAVRGVAERLWADALAVHGRIDVLVNNAGAWLASPVDDAEAWDDGWAANLAINLTAPASLCRLAIQHFRNRSGDHGGIIVNVTSRSAHRGDDAEHLAYGAAKGGLLALTRGIARGFARERVLAYAVAPGPVATDMLAGVEDLAEQARNIPMGEIAPPGDVAEAVAFLASGRSPHATGTTIDISGADYVR
jgi:3-oxoacyl-[acyl-carrier protein] reductase